MKKKMLALVLAAAMTLSLAACGGSKTDAPADTSTDAPADADTSADATVYKVGICQLVQHEALDAATQGFIDALNEALPGQVEIENNNASGDATNCATIVNGYVSEGVDLIMANATAALTAAASATADIPFWAPPSPLTAWLWTLMTSTVPWAATSPAPPIWPICPSRPP